MDNFDRVYSYLIEEEGLSPEDATRAMVIMVEQGFDPTQVFLGGLAKMLGYLPQKKSSGERVTTPRQKVKKPEMAKPIRDPWNQFPKKPQPQQGLPKPPSSRLPTRALPPARPIPTPNQTTQGMLGSRSVPTSRQLGQAPVPQFGPDKARQWGPAKPPTAYERIRPSADAGIKARVRLNTPRSSASTARGGGSPISAVVSALTDLQGSTPQSGPAAERARANRETAIQAKWGTAMNQTPSRFGKAGPDVPATPAAKPAPKPAVAPVATKPKPAPVERTKAKLQPEVKRPEPAKPVDPRLQKYRDLIKKGQHGAARKLGKEIHADKYGVPTTKTA